MKRRKEKGEEGEKGGRGRRGRRRERGRRGKGGEEGKDGGGGGEREGDDLYGIPTYTPIVKKDKLSDFQDPDHYTGISYQVFFFFGQLLYQHTISFSQPTRITIQVKILTLHSF